MLNPLRYTATPRPARVAPERVHVSPLENKINRLLAAWYEFRRGYAHTRGYSGSDSTCRDYRTPTHWDWRNGAEDDRADQEQMRGVDRAIDRIPNQPQPWNTAIQYEAMNLHSGAGVWSSNRLPKGPELEVLRLEARNRLLRELQREGVIS